MSETTDNSKAGGRCAPAPGSGTHILVYSAGIEAGRRLERQDCWDAINKWIKHGDLPGDGCDQTAQRNGMILASNVIMERIRPNGQHQR